MKNKIVIYTAIFGSYDGLIPQIKIPGVDYICFTDQPFKSKVWKIIKVKPEFEDTPRNSRKFKVLPHLFLKDYEYSVFMDGNYLVKRDITDFVLSGLQKHKMMIYDHNQCSDARDCVYDEYEALIKLGQETGSFRDDPEIMERQIEKYKSDNYPKNNGLIFSAVLIRRHHDPEVIELMEKWWSEIENGSKRDQLSFNYAAWKVNFKPYYISGDLRNNENFLFLGKHRKSYKGKYFRYRLKKFFGLKK